jgi:hypothetical protein
LLTRSGQRVAGEQAQHDAPTPPHDLRRDAHETDDEALELLSQHGTALLDGGF